MFELQRRRGHPVYLQIQEQLERRIASGTLRAGEPLPSVRALAKQLRINPNTVVRAYRELEFLGLVETRQGEGTFVASGVPRERQARVLLRDRARQYVREARELGVTRTQAVAAVEASWKRKGDARRTAVA